MFSKYIVLYDVFSKNIFLHADKKMSENKRVTNCLWFINYCTALRYSVTLLYATLLYIGG